MTKKTQSPHSPADLYVLLIGINNYKNHQLRGCVNDVNQIKRYLSNTFVEAQFGQIYQLVLLNEQATKDKIVQAVRKHLGRAKKNDSILFYFSGHGAREKTSYRIFQDEEVDNNIGGILCATFEGSNQPELYRHILSNKELRYLIRPLAMDEANKIKSHVVAIFDCCHSGSNTRAVLENELPANARQVSRRALSGRAMHQFIFQENPELLGKLKEQKDPLNKVLPQGDHIMIAACREVELAWEKEISKNKQSGAFTTALIDVLRQHKGYISYHELSSRILNRMKFSLSSAKGNRGQTPQVYVQTRNLNDRYHIFLTNQLNDQPSYGSVEYNEDDGEWRIDMGAFHGIVADQEAAPTIVKVYPFKKKNQVVEVKIKKVYPFHANLDFSPSAMLQGEGPYRGELGGLSVSPIGVFLKGDKKVTDETSKLLKIKLNKTVGQLFRLVAKELDADYALCTSNGMFSITRPFDEARPVVKQINYRNRLGQFDEQKVTYLFSVLQQMSRWSFLKDLQHSSNVFPSDLVGKTTMYPVEFRLYRLNEEDGREQRIIPKDNKFILKVEDHHKPLWLRIELVNHSSQILNCSLAIMTEDFGFLIPRRNNLMKAPVLMLQKAEDEKDGHIAKSIGAIPEFLKNEVKEKYFSLTLNDYYRHFNLQGDSTFFKLIVSTKPLDAIETFHMKALGYPREEKDVLTRGDDWGDAYQLEEPELPEVEWDIRTIEVYMTNPAFDHTR